MTPAPAPALAVDDRPAGLGRRFVAALVDQVLVLVLGGGLVVVASLRVVLALRDDPTTLPALPVPLLALGSVLALAVTVTQWLLHGRHGWTLGRRLLGVRTVDAHSRRPLGPWRVLLRGLVVAAGVLACGVGQLVVLLSPLFDRTGRCRGWHDRAAGAEVLRVATVAVPAGSRPGRGAHAVPVRGPQRPAAPADPAPSGPAVDDAPFRPPAAAAVPPPFTGATPVVGAHRAGPPTDGLVLAPLHQQRSAPDLDTRAIPVVRAEDPALTFGLAPELELTRPAPPRTDVLPEPRAAASGLRVTLDDGRGLTVERVALVGRNPTPAPAVQVVRVVDPGRSVSKTHLQLEVDATGAWVVDRGSTNGTVVTLPDGGQVVCRVDHPVRLREGVVVAFGDRSLRVVQVPARGAGDPA
jgi:uncharacterized RDD family membrane protein YckC